MSIFHFMKLTHMDAENRYNVLRKQAIRIIQSDLICISLGRPTYSGCFLRLDVVEARPKDLGDRPNVFDEILLAYGVYARMIGATGIRIMNPVNEEVRAYYETFGYTYASKSYHLFREVT